VRIAELIATALRNRTDTVALAKVRSDVAELCANFPVY